MEPQERFQLSGGIGLLEMDKFCIHFNLQFYREVLHYVKLEDMFFIQLAQLIQLKMKQLSLKHLEELLLVLLNLLIFTVNSHL